jgi:hypothetical protein
MQTMKNKEYQEQLYHRGSSNKKYGQNEKVYNYYKDIYNQKIRRDQNLEHNFVDLAKER